jgi:hypothetical protein
MWIVPARSPMVRVSIGRVVVMALDPCVDFDGPEVPEESNGANEGGIVLSSRSVECRQRSERMAWGQRITTDCYR